MFCCCVARILCFKRDANEKEREREREKEKRRANRDDDYDSFIIITDYK